MLSFRRLPMSLAALCPAPSGAAFTLNPSDKNANISLSNGNLTGMKTTANGFAAVRATGKVSSGKFSIRATIDRGVINFGVCSATAGLSGLPGNNDSSGVGYSSNDGFIYANGGSTYGTLGVGSVADVVDVACDVTNRLIWFRRNGGAWSNGGNPETGTSGITMNNGIATGDIYPFLHVYFFNVSGGLGDQGTVDFGTSVSASYPAFNSVAS